MMSILAKNFAKGIVSGIGYKLGLMVGDKIVKEIERFVELKQIGKE